MNWPQKIGTLFLDGREMPTGSVGIAVIGFSRANFGPFPLPLEFPGSKNAVTGACNLFASLDILNVVPTTSSGTARLGLPIPAQKEFHGAKVFGQWLTLDPGAGNAFGMPGSNGVEFQWIAPFPTSVPVGRVYAASSLSPSGSAQAAFGMVTQLR